MEVIIKETYEEMSRAAAQDVARLLNTKPNAVLGLATGSTPLGLYQELVRMHKEEGLDFSQVTTFNLDEYVGLRPAIRRATTTSCTRTSSSTSTFRSRTSTSPRAPRQLPGVLRVVRAADRGVRRHRPADSGDRLRRPHRLQRAEQFAGLPHAHQDPGQADDRGQRPLLREAVRTCRSTPSRWAWARSSRPDSCSWANGKKKAEAVAAAIEGPVTSMITASALQLHRTPRCFSTRAPPAS